MLHKSMNAETLIMCSSMIRWQ